MKYIAPALILFFIVVRIPVNSFRVSFQILALYCAAILFAYMLSKKGHICAALLVGISTVMSFYPICSFSSVMGLKSVLVGVLMYFAVVELDLDFEATMNVLCVACLVHLFYIFCQAAGYNPYSIYGLETTTKTCVGLTANINEASAMIALLSPAFFRRKWCYLLPFVVAGLYFAKTTGGALAFCSIVLVYLFMNGYRKIAVFIPFVAMVLVNLYMDQPSVGPRLSCWVKMIEVYFSNDYLIVGGSEINRSWLVGFGVGHFRDLSIAIFGKIEGQYMIRAHNTFLQCFFELGVLFFFVLIPYAYYSVKAALKNPVFLCALVSIFICCSVNSVFRINAINGMIVILWLGMLKSLDN